MGADELLMDRLHPLLQRPQDVVTTDRKRRPVASRTEKSRLVFALKRSEPPPLSIIGATAKTGALKYLCVSFFSGSCSTVSSVLFKLVLSQLRSFVAGFDRRPAAAAWLKPRERALSKPGAIAKLKTLIRRPCQGHRPLYRGTRHGDWSHKSASLKGDQEPRHRQHALFFDQIERHR